MDLRWKKDELAVRIENEDEFRFVGIGMTKPWLND